MVILTVQNLVKQYKGKGKNNLFPALNGLNFHVDSGEFVAVMGPSGSGKTTLLHILSGIDTEYSGSVQLAGSSLSSMKKDQLALLRRQRMGFVFQDYNLLDSLTLRDNIMLPLVLEEQEPEEIEARTAELLSRFGLEEAQDKYPYTVSGGQQQRAAIARAIINGPEIVFADEPTGNLDSKSAETVMRTLSGLNKNQQVTIVMVTHDPFAASCSRRVVFIKDGTVNHELSREKGASRKAFLGTILDSLALTGGVEDDF
ncbi:hypothetical protein R70723_21830 [Paenibacillus sp. FSL R7-0273]|uniref:ABC transporter ATP-binding protein n=1 Tax=Paenibacillus sp. FSL R7-0273 TaxID=1536772 RepID=UPI0004F894F5|nr:ABC transporter ATP-binding protein [Paenibacillus sp. FSL R7-0273]AIQ48258.1 hypothetical protein R70723_21830 [Paenibacillus sp. FSL R7-0273]OMF92024.1 multidrug ABC transporter ATP-binding protein [Paenibacillus sp. FSL R7-0273]